jgi:outer membrane protein assembly factor BamB
MRGPLLLVLVAGCPSPRPPSGPAAAPVTIEIGGPLRGVAGDGSSLFAAIGDHVSARGAHPWSVALPGTGGPLAAGHGLVYAAASAKLRGDPAAIISALDAATGAERWKLPIDSTGWSVVTALAATSDGVLAAGSFQGTLRAGDAVVGSAGETDGFVARVSAAGKVVWLVRMGGPGADALQGVATSGDRIAIAGTFAPGADLLGEPLHAINEDLPFADAFAAELDARGARVWSATYGGKLDDAVAGCAFDSAGHVVVAGTARDVVHGDAQELTATGTQAIVATLSRDDASARLLPADGASAIAAAHGSIVVAGYTGTDAILVSLAGAAWKIDGPGREEITALATVPGGFVAGLAHTAAVTVDGTALPAPADPLAGGALLVR